MVRKSRGGGSGGDSGGGGSGGGGDGGDGSDKQADGTTQTTLQTANRDENISTDEIPENDAIDDAVAEVVAGQDTEDVPEFVEAIEQAREGNTIDHANFAVEMDEEAIEEAIDGFGDDDWDVSNIEDFEDEIDDLMDLDHNERKELLTRLSAEDVEEQFAEHQMHMGELERRLQAAEMTPEPLEDVDDPSEEAFAVRDEAIDQVGAEAVVIAEEDVDEVVVNARDTEVTVAAYGGKTEVHVEGENNDVEVYGEIGDVGDVVVDGSENTLTVETDVETVGDIDVRGKSNELHFEYEIGSVTGRLDVGKESEVTYEKDSLFGLRTKTEQPEIDGVGNNKVTFERVDSIGSTGSESVNLRNGAELTIQNAELIGGMDIRNSQVNFGEVEDIYRLDMTSGHLSADSIENVGRKPETFASSHHKVMSTEGGFNAESSTIEAGKLSLNGVGRVSDSDVDVERLPVGMTDEGPVATRYVEFTGCDVDIGVVSNRIKQDSYNTETAKGQSTIKFEKSDVHIGLVDHDESIYQGKIRGGQGPLELRFTDSPKSKIEEIRMGSCVNGSSTTIGSVFTDEGFVNHEEEKLFLQKQISNVSYEDE